jgi:hypothetical protein
MNVCALCHFDQREKSRAAKDEISRYRSKDKKKHFAPFKTIGSKQIILSFRKRLKE